MNTACVPSGDIRPLRARDKDAVSVTGVVVTAVVVMVDGEYVVYLSSHGR